MALHWAALAALAVLAASCGPSHALPRPEETAMLITTSAPTATTFATTPESVAPAETPAEQTKTPPPQVRSLHVNSDVQYRYAHTVVSSRVANPANHSQEVTFSVVLPETAFISSFAMEVDGKVYHAYVQEKKEAKQTYDAAVAAGQSAAHVAVSARDSNSFTVSLNVEAQNKVSFNLTYEELLTRALGLYQHVITLNPGQVVSDLQVRVHIKENKNIIRFRVPEFSSGNKIDADIQDCDDTSVGKSSNCSSGNSKATISWKSPSDVEVLFRPSEEDQREIVARLEEKKKTKKKGEDAALSPNQNRWGGDLFLSPDERSGVNNQDDGLNGQFSVEYDVERSADGGDVVVNDGYFVHFFSPAELKPLNKHAVFVLDVSGSMDGRKIEQLREAMVAILDDLKDGDYFNLIQFSSDVKVWNLDNPDKSALYRPSEGHFYGEPPGAPTGPPPERPPAYRATPSNIDAAKRIVGQMSAYGGTNIFDALKTALDCARDGTRNAAISDSDQTLEPIILFLTDGDPTVGLTAPTKITSGISELNLKPRSAIFSLAFGDVADIKFLRKISLANAGFARTIYEAADASAQLKNFYRQISSPLLANVTFRYIPDKIERDSITKLNFRTFFDGTELVVAGRTTDKGVQEVGGDVEAISDGGKHTNYKPRRVSVDGPLIADWPFHPEAPVSNHTHAPRQVSVLERLWAYLTIKQLLDEQDAQDAVNGKEDVIRPTWVGPPQHPVAMPAMPPMPAKPAVTLDQPRTTERPANLTSDLDLSVLKPSPKQKALDLALKYSFVTPLTSLVVVKPNETKATDAQTVNPADSSKAGAFPGAVSMNRFGTSGSAYHAHYALALSPQQAAAPMAPLGMAFHPPSNNVMVAPRPPPPQPPPPPPFTTNPSAGSAAAGQHHVLLTDERDPVSHTLATRPRPPSTTPSSASISAPSSDPITMANVSEVKWLPKNALQTGLVVLPLNVNGTDKTYKISNTEADPEPPQTCEIVGAEPVKGVCRHFSHCVLAKVVERIEDFVKYQCTIGEYLAICCPPDDAPVKQSTPTV